MAENTIAQAYVQILPTTDGIQSSLTSALQGPAEASGQSAGSSMGSGIAKGLGTVGKVAGATFAAVGTAAVGATAAFTSGVGSVAEYGDNIDKMAQKMGLSVESYQEWDAVMQHSGTSMESMKASMKTLANAAASGSDAFDALGISQEAIAGMSQEELFEATISALQNVEDETQRTYLAGKTLGRGATELGALLNTSAEDTQAMRDRVRELGGVMSEDSVKAAAAYQDSLQDMSTAFSGLSRNLMSEFLPGVTTVMNGLTEIFAGNSEGGLGMITEGIDGVIQSIAEKVPEFAGTAMEIIKALGTAIIQNIPTLMPAAVQIVIDMAQYIINNLPMVIEVALQMILAISDGLITALPELIPALIEVILTIVDKLTDPDTLVQLVDAALQIMIALAEGLISAIPQLIAKAPEIILNLATAIIKAGPRLAQAGDNLMRVFANGIIASIGAVFTAAENIGLTIHNSIANVVDQAWSWGADLIQSFIDGIIAKWNSLVNTVRGVAQTVRNYIGFSEPKEGPLSNFHTYAPDMMQLFAEGIRENEDLIANQLSESLNFGNRIGRPASGQMVEVPRGGSGSAGRQMTVILECDRMQLGRLVYQLNNDETQRVGVKLAGGNA